MAQSPEDKTTTCVDCCTRRPVKHMWVHKGEARCGWCHAKARSAEIEAEKKISKKDGEGA